MLGRLTAAALCALAPVGSTAFTLLDQQRNASLAIQRFTSTCPWDGGFLICPNRPPTQTTTENFLDADGAPDFGDFGATESVAGFDASASLVSTTTATTLQASGDRSANPARFTATLIPPSPLTTVSEVHTTSSLYLMRFELTEPTSYVLEGEAALSTDGAGSIGEYSVVELTGPGVETVARGDVMATRDCDFQADFYCGRQATLSQSGVLAPGTYTLMGATLGDTGSAIHYYGVNDGHFDLSLTLTPPPPPVVPALHPAAVATLAGLLLAVARRRG